MGNEKSSGIFCSVQTLVLQKSIQIIQKNSNYFELDNPPVSFKQMNPTDTAYHIVRILIITLSINARETSIPSKVNKPIKEPSVTPIPPGINDTAPIITDDE